MFNEKQDSGTDWKVKFQTKEQDFYKQVVTSIKEHGEQLFFAEDKEIVFKDWNGGTHRDLSTLLGSQKVKDDFEGGKLFKKILYILQFMCIKFAGKDLWIPNGAGGYKENMKEHERKTFIGSHSETDVLLAYILLHISARGEIMSVNVDIDERQVLVDFDLRNVDFLGSNNLQDGLFYYELKRPINIRNKQVTHFILGPCSFSQIAETPFSGTTEKVQFDPISYLANSIYYVPELSSEKIIIQSRELNNLSLNDIKGMREALGKHYIGINMIVEFDDPELQQKFPSYLPWYDSSFLI